MMNDPKKSNEQEKQKFERYYTKFGEGFEKKVHKIYKSKRWQHVRKQVFKRELFTCQHCKCYIKSRPQCHHKIHITPSNIHDEDIVYNLDNIELLCVGCHNRVHEPDRKPHVYQKIEKEQDDVNLF